MRRPNLRIIGIEECKDSLFKGPVSIFNKIIEENFPDFRKEMPTNMQDTCRTADILDQNRNSVKTDLNSHNKI